MFRFKSNIFDKYKSNYSQSLQCLTCKYTILLILILPSQEVYCQAEKTFSIGKYDKLHSEIYQRDREFIVHVPDASDQKISTETYPVLFLLDGDVLFTKTVGILNHLSSAYGGEKCPKMIIVGIQHPNRMKDLLPVVSKDNPDMKDNFTDFLKKELIPYIDKHYPTQPYRVLAGHSLGGLRTANTLIYHQQLFNAYIALDPSMGHDMNQWSFKTDGILKQKSFDNKSCFVAMAHTMPPGMDTAVINRDTGGAARHMRAIMRFCNGINDYGVKGINFGWKYYPEEAHAGVTFSGMYDGLSYIFRWYQNKEHKKIFEPATSVNDAIGIISKHFDKVSAYMGYKVHPPEQYVNDIINYLLGREMNEKAHAFAELNFKNYPASESAAGILKETRWLLKKPLTTLLANKTVKEICDLCLAEFKKTDPEYNVSEYAINVLGYQLLEDNKINDALLVFILNTELYPNSGNVWDSYGECLLLLGREKDGIEAYKKSLELDPQNKNAERIIKKYGEK